MIVTIPKLAEHAGSPTNLMTIENPILALNAGQNVVLNVGVMNADILTPILRSGKNWENNLIKNVLRLSWLDRN